MLLPLLILHGSKDCLTDLDSSQALYKEATSEDKTLKLYPESWHAFATAEPDDVSDSVMRDILGWLNDRTKAA